MRLLYLSNSRLPTEKANGLQIVKTCEAFSRQGVEVSLLYPRRVQTERFQEVSDMLGYYEVRHRFACHALSCLDWRTPKIGWLRRQDAIRYWVQTGTYSLAAESWLRRHFQEGDVIYSRAEHLAPLLTRLSFRAPVFFELHNWPRAPASLRWLRRLAGRARGLVTITEGLKRELVEVGVTEDKILVAHDGVDMSLFDLTAEEPARETSGDTKRIVYTGHLYEWKGIAALLESSRHISVDHEVVIVGGLPEDIARWKGYCADRGLQKIRFAGYVTPSEVPGFLKQADLVVLPNSGKAEISRSYTSPLKLFEYMASGRPIVASRLPSLQEVLIEGHDALMFEPDNPVDLGEKITSLLKDPSVGVTLSQNARRKVEAYSWEARAERILGFIADRATPDDGSKRSGR